MRPLPLPGGFRRAIAAIVALACLALAGPAAGAVVPTFTRVTQEGGPGAIGADCTAPLPGGAGAGSATYSHFAGTGTILTNWNIPAQITAGSQVTLSLQVNATQSLFGQILLSAPTEFGGAPAPFEVAGSVGPGGGSFGGSKTITFTPTRAFTPGETLFLRLGNGCNAFLYEYVATGTPDATPATPAEPRLSPRTTRPVPGVVTSYAAPRPGKTAALPFPKDGCAPAATTTARGTQAPPGGECSVDIFLRRNGGGDIHDPEAGFGVAFTVSDKNLEAGFALCYTMLLDELGRDVESRIYLQARAAQCAVVVSRILQRAEDLRARRARAPSERVPHAAHGCRVGSVRLTGSARRASPLRVICRHTRTGVRLTFRSARAGQPVSSLIKPSSKLIVVRGDAPRRAGDRLDVLWKITPPPTTTTIRTPTPLP